MFGALTLALIVNLVIPVIGFFVSYWILNDLGSKIEIDIVIVITIHMIFSNKTIYRCVYTNPYVIFIKIHI